MKIIVKHRDIEITIEDQYNGDYPSHLIGKTESVAVIVLVEKLTDNVLKLIK